MRIVSNTVFLAFAEIRSESNRSPLIRMAFTELSLALRTMFINVFSRSALLSRASDALKIEVILESRCRSAQCMIFNTFHLL